MKKYKISLLTLLCTLMVSCDGFLDIPLESSIATSNYFNTVQDFEMALTGAYNTLLSAEGANDDRYGSYFYGLLVMGRVGTDEMYMAHGNNGEPELGSYTYTPVNKFVSRTWYMMYRGIQRTCVLIDRMAEKGGSFSSADRNRILGEAHFLRAFFYFHLVRFYGEVPLVVNEVTNIENVNLSKNSVTDVYQQIIADLEKASTMLSVDGAVGHVHQYAAKSLLGKVYLQMSGQPLNDSSAAVKAEKYFAEVINSGKFTIYGAKSEDDYFSLFDASNEHSSEHIWDVEFSNSDGTTRFGGQVGTIDGVRTPNNLYWSQVLCSQEFYETFHADDNRKNSVARFRFIFGDDGKTLVKNEDESIIGNTYYAYKFRHPLSEEERGSTWANWSNPINFPIIRYSDVLLSYAEAVNRAKGAPTIEALEYVNMVRRRGFLKDINSPNAAVDLKMMSKEQFEEALLAERGWELCFEGHRWVDLVRFGELEAGVKSLSKYEKTMSHTSQAANFHSKHKYFPIPQDVVDASSGAISQNPNWL